MQINEQHSKQILFNSNVMVSIENFRNQQTTNIHSLSFSHIPVRTAYSSAWNQCKWPFYQVTLLINNVYLMPQLCYLSIQRIMFGRDLQLYQNIEFTCFGSLCGSREKLEDCVSGWSRQVALVVKDCKPGHAAHEHRNRWTGLLAFILVRIALLACRIHSTSWDQLVTKAWAFLNNLKETSANWSLHESRKKLSREFNFCAKLWVKFPATFLSCQQATVIKGGNKGFAVGFESCNTMGLTLLES